MAEDTLNIVQKKVAVELEIDPTLKAPKVNKYQWLIDLSEAVDAWRIFPRVFISTYIYLLYKTTIWFTTLPDPNTAQAGLISVVVGAGALGLVYMRELEVEVEKLLLVNNAIRRIQ